MVVRVMVEVVIRCSVVMVEVVTRGNGLAGDSDRGGGGGSRVKCDGDIVGDFGGILSKFSKLAKVKVTFETLYKNCKE